MPSILTNKIIQEIIAVVIILGLIFFIAIKPRIDLDAAEDENERKETKIRTITHESKTKSFSTKYKAIKDENKPKEKIHEEPNLSVGIHTIIFD